MALLTKCCHFHYITEIAERQGRKTSEIGCVTIIGNDKKNVFIISWIKPEKGLQLSQRFWSVIAEVDLLKTVIWF